MPKVTRKLKGTPTMILPQRVQVFWEGVLNEAWFPIIVQLSHPNDLDQWMRSILSEESSVLAVCEFVEAEPTQFHVTTLVAWMKAWVQSTSPSTASAVPASAPAAPAGSSF